VIAVVVTDADGRAGEQASCVDGSPFNFLVDLESRERKQTVEEILVVASASGGIAGIARKVPKQRRRHAITETAPPVKAALDELRGGFGDGGSTGAAPRASSKHGHAAGPGLCRLRAGLDSRLMTRPRLGFCLHID
jgi:hypothetical protein